MALLDFLKPKDEKLTQKIATLEKELETKQLQFQELSTKLNLANEIERLEDCLLYTSPSPRDCS